jgi:hypothetical protein
LKIEYRQFELSFKRLFCENDVSAIKEEEK